MDIDVAIVGLALILLMFSLFFLPRWIRTTLWKIFKTVVGVFVTGVIGIILLMIRRKDKKRHEEIMEGLRRIRRALRI